MLNNNIPCLTFALARAGLLLPLLFFLLVQLQLGASFPVLNVGPFRHTYNDLDNTKHDDNNNNNNNDNVVQQLQPQLGHHSRSALKQHKHRQHQQQMLLALIRQQLDNNDQQQEGEKQQQQQADQQQQQKQKQSAEAPSYTTIGIQAMGTYLDWVEAETHSVYVFAFTYFGVITLLLIALVVFVSFCYMYDCMGCYDGTAPLADKCRAHQQRGSDASWSASGGGGRCAGANSVFPVAFPLQPPPQYSDNKTERKSISGSCISSSCSRAGSRRWSSSIAHL